MREPGYYWVKFLSLWEIAYWSDDKVWWRIHNNLWWADSDMDEIGGRVWRPGSEQPATTS